MSKIINFDKTKEKFINDKFPNISKFDQSKTKSTYYKSNRALESFQKVFYQFTEYVHNPAYCKEIKVEELLLYFNKYFDEIYKETVVFDSDKVPILKEAMDYAMLSNGKRLRPFLMYCAYSFCEGKDIILLTPFMLAIELIHTFSLIHDDLPCMDNDELRRGKPTVWKKYGEDIAVLVGDALVIHAATILSEITMELNLSPFSPFATTSSLILMRLAGIDGMIAGQVYDIQNTKNKNLTLNDYQYMYQKKTTALIAASIVVGANMATTMVDKIGQMEKLGIDLGDLYQIQDDLLEIESTTEKIGKSTNSDKKNGKNTMVSLIGVDEAKKRIKNLYMSCMIQIENLTTKSNELQSEVFKKVIDYVLTREK